MAFILADRVKETCSAPGTGTVTLLGAATGYQSFSAGIGANNTTYYVIADQGGANWEVGYGTIGSGGTTLARTTVLSSSNSGSLVNFTSGTQDVFCDYPASKSVSTDYTNAIGVVSPSSVKATSLSAPLSNLASSNTSTFQLGSNLSFSDTGITNNIVGSTNSYLQSVLQNTNSGSSASAEYIVYNDQGTASTNFATVGINSSGYSGTGSINAPGYGYFLTGSTDLVLGTIGNNKIHFATNSQATDAVTIGTDNSLTVNGTITGQTEVLKGTGENLFLYSQDFTNASWGKTNLTVTTGITAPDGTSTANKLVENTANAQHLISEFITPTTGLTYTYSIYAKAAEWTSFQLQLGSSGPLATFNLSAVTASQTGGISATITSVGNGWYRCVLTGVSNGNGSYYIYKNATTYVGDGTSGMYVWGAQLEVGSLISPYTATTSSQVYGTPTLSFSGVAGLGLQSDGSLYVSPAGTGALQAQATTSSTVGGNARGANAVDWQTSRSSASQVAGSQYAVLGGGGSNTSGGYGAVVSGGLANNNVAAYGFIGGGYNNSQNSNYLGTYAVIGGGQGNSALGIYNTVGGGFTNSGTSASAVTTQSGTMNGTTAVTLSGSNASIKVGQYITGTSIASETYVAAISGTALTLSKNASGSGTATLSFYTPHGVVVGGGNNQATGSYSFIGGGGDAGTAANRNVASGDWSFVGGGYKNTASGLYSCVNGSTNTSSGDYSAIIGGLSNTSSGAYSTVSGGRSNTASGNYSVVVGGSFATTRAITGNTVFGAEFSPIGGNGATQSSLLVVAQQTTNATPTVLTSDGGAASGTNQVVLPNGQTSTVTVYTFSVLISAHNSANTTDIAGWKIEGVISRGNGVGTTVLVGTPSVTLLGATTGAITAGWGTVSNVAAVADTTYGALQIKVTGVASTTIRWSATIINNELAY